MDNYYLNKRNFYSFVRSVLTAEANLEKVPVFLEHKVGDKVFDAWFPLGLRLFKRFEFQNVLVDIDYSINAEKFENIKRWIERKGLDCKYICITNAAVFNTMNQFDVTYHSDSEVFGKSFIEELVEKYPDIYLSAILSDPEVTLNSDYQKNEDYEKREMNLYIEKHKKKMYVSEDDPEKLNKVFENDFKAYLSNNKEEPTDCAVIIGNGASIPFGSDSWTSMINNLSNYLEPYFVESSSNIRNALFNSSYAISSFVKNTLIRNGLSDKYIEAIHYCVYRRYNPLMHDRPSILKALALAKQKYPYLPLLTYNYDTFLEKQYKHETSKGLLYLNGNDGFQPSPNVYKNNVIHLHGYLSYSTKKYSGLVLTDEEYFDAYLNSIRSWVYNTQIDVLRNYKCLYVGSSMSDLFQMSVINKARKGRGNEKWNCFALMCFKDLSLKEKMELIKYYLEKGVKVIFVEAYDKLPAKLAELFGVNL